MSRKLRVVAIVVGVLVVALLVLPFLIPVNQFRPTIEEKASAALGRKVQVGNLSLSLLRGGISAEDLSIADDPKFSSSPFLTANSAIAVLIESQEGDSAMTIRHKLQQMGFRIEAGVRCRQGFVLFACRRGCAQMEQAA